MAVLEAVDRSIGQHDSVPDRVRAQYRTHAVQRHSIASASSALRRLTIFSPMLTRNALMSFFVLSCDPAWGRLWPSLDCASLGHRRGRDHPRAAFTLRLTSGAEIVKEDDSLTH